MLWRLQDVTKQPENLTPMSNLQFTPAEIAQAGEVFKEFYGYYFDKDREGRPQQFVYHTECNKEARLLGSRNGIDYELHVPNGDTVFHEPYFFSVVLKDRIAFSSVFNFNWLEMLVNCVPSQDRHPGKFQIIIII